MPFDFSSLFNPQGQPLLGLDVSSFSVKLVELSERGEGDYCLERYVIEPLPRDALVDGNIVNLEAVAETVGRAWRRLGSPVKRVAMALPATAVITKKIELPAGLREEEMEVQVESEANQYIPFALEEVNLDFQIIGPVPNSADEVEVLIAASRKEKVEDRVAVAEAAGLKVLVVDVESYAAQAAFTLVAQNLPNQGRGRVVGLVDVGANTTNFTALKDGETLYSREQAFGGSQLTQDMVRDYGLSPEEAEAAKRSGDFPEGCAENLLRPFAENLAMEVARALQFFFTSTPHTALDDIVLCGGSASLPGVVDAVAARTGANVVIANPFTGMRHGDHVREKALAGEAPMLLVATGLALRRTGE